METIAVGQDLCVALATSPRTQASTCQLLGTLGLVMTLAKTVQVLLKLRLKQHEHWFPGTHDMNS